MKGLSKVALLLAVLSPSAFAQWELQGADSSVNYVTVKASKVGEVNQFNKVSGSLNDAGEVTINIDLTSVDTKVEVRDGRMKEMLFETSKFLEAKISGSVDMKKVAALKAGDTYTDSISFNLSLHGVSKEVISDAQVTKLNGDKLLVTSLKPIVISASDYGLEAGVEKLREVAQLPSISTAVPVTYNLLFVDKK